MSQKAALTEYAITLTPRDPIIVRDGRPFGAESGRKARTLDWPTPSVFAGSLRSLIGKRAGADWDRIRAELEKMAVAGPFALVNDAIHVPAPADLLVDDESEPWCLYPLRPLAKQSRAGCDLPDESLQPVGMLKPPEEDFKPSEANRLWPMNRVMEWLTDASGECFCRQNLKRWPKEYLPRPEREERVHVKIVPERGTAEEGMLFSTNGLALDALAGRSSTARLIGRLRTSANGCLANALKPFFEMHPMGGERRVLGWNCSQEHAFDLARCSTQLAGQLAKAAPNGSLGIRLLLLTPARFKNGWLPGWLTKESEGYVGAPPTCNGAGSGVRLKLVGACLGRWIPISGYQYKPPRGPKKVERYVPAGSVYFFEVVEGDGGKLTERHWFESVSDDCQAQRDGSGLAAWGVWDRDHIMKSKDGIQ